jgi:hypothetical protein
MSSAQTAASAPSPPQQPELVGTAGVSLEIDADLPTAHVMTALKEKIVNPQRFLPVTNVRCRPSDDGAGTYREMTVTMGDKTSVMIENIYHDNVGLVRFVVVDDPNEHINVIEHDAATGARRLKFGKRNSTTHEAVFWCVSDGAQLDAIITHTRN